MRRGMRLHPDDADDPRVFRAGSPSIGVDLHAAFSATPAVRAGTMRLLMEEMSSQKTPDLAPIAGAILMRSESAIWPARR
jgi:hypothetical protein